MKPYASNTTSTSAPMPRAIHFQARRRFDGRVLSATALVSMRYPPLLAMDDRRWPRSIVHRLSSNLDRTDDWRYLGRASRDDRTIRAAASQQRDQRKAKQANHQWGEDQGGCPDRTAHDLRIDRVH